MNREQDTSDRRAFIARTATLAALGSGTASLASTVRQDSTDDDDDKTLIEHAGGGGSDGGGIDLDTLAEAEKLAGIDFTPSEREQILRTIGEQRALLEARLAAGPLPETLPPAQIFRALLPGTEPERATPDGDPWSNLPDPGPCPKDDLDLAFAPVWRLGQWLRDGEVTSERLTRLALERLRRHDPELRCVITLTEELALEQAARADQELRNGDWRGPLHGVPWGAKDLIDTADIPTTWGAEPFRDRVAGSDAFVVERLREAGAVLVAKLAVGALAYGDLWFGGRCRNPFDTGQGSSGSSAGSASATAAGLIPFTLGTETYGSIVSPCDRCGATGLRPTFGRVARNGVMALCWSLDKIGPICRSVLDTALVLKAINGSDPLDPSSVDESFTYDPAASAEGLRVGYDPAWFEDPAGARVLEAARRTGVRTVEIEVPEMNTAPLLVPLFTEAAASFEMLTRNDLDDRLVWQDDAAWPNTFRSSWFIPGVEAVQADRVRRQVMQVMHDFMNDAEKRIDAVLCPPFVDNLLLVTNATGHPSLVLRSGFGESGRPTSITLIGRLFDEGTLCRIGRAMEAELGVQDRRPESTT